MSRSRRIPAPLVPSLRWLRQEAEVEPDRRAYDRTPAKVGRLVEATVDFEDFLSDVRASLPADTSPKKMLDAAWEGYYAWLVRRLGAFSGKVYRSVTLADLSDLNPRALGIYWTWDPEAAEAYWGSEEDTHYLIEGVVDPTDVDWEMTLIANARLPDEKEITLLPGSLVRVASVTVQGDDEVLLGGFDARANPGRRR